MISTFVCQHCGYTCRCNPRIKNQKYCSKKECQKARKLEWEKRRYRTNKKYRKTRLISQKTWRKNYPHKEYQKEYRSRRPDYVARCYARQNESYHERRKAEQEANEQNNVNTDAIFTRPRRGGLYKLTPMGETKNNVNTDSFIVQMQILSG
jgi:hypothetical protein